MKSSFGRDLILACTIISTACSLPGSSSTATFGGSPKSANVTLDEYADSAKQLGTPATIAAAKALSFNQYYEMVLTQSRAYSSITVDGLEFQNPAALIQHFKPLISSLNSHYKNIGEY